MTTPLSPKGSTARRKNPLHPFPDAVSREAGEQWEVCRPLMGKLPATDLDKRKMYVPDGDSEVDKGVRLHEMLHVKLTPGDQFKKVVKRAKVPFAYHIAEDIRLGHYAREWGFDAKGATPENEAVQLVEQTIASGKASDLVLSIGSLAYSHKAMDLRRILTGKLPKDPIMANAFEATLSEISYSERSMFGNGYKSFKDFTVKFGKRLEQLCEAYDTEQKFEEKKQELEEEGKDPGRMVEATISRKAHPKILKMVESIEKEEAERNLDPYKIDKPVNTTGRKTLMRIETPPLVHRIRVKGEAFARSSSEEGTVPTRMTNFCSSGRVFDRKARLKGGTIVLDGSGSMAVTDAMVQSLVDAAPASTIAVYWGGPSTLGMGDYGVKYHGVLRILVKNGITVDRSYMRSDGQGNTVDIPALQWALAQKGPRYWISDGQVCGSHEYENDQEIEMCMKLCRTGNIKRFENIRDAVEHIVGQDKDNEKVHLRGEGIGSYA